MRLKAVIGTGKSTELPPTCQISSLDRHTAKHCLECRQIRAYSPRFYLDQGSQLFDAGTSNWTWGKLDETLAANKMFKIMMPKESACLDFTELANLLTRHTDKTNLLPIGPLLAEDEPQRLTHNLWLIGQDGAAQVSQV